MIAEKMTYREVFKQDIDNIYHYYIVDSSLQDSMLSTFYKFPQLLDLLTEIGAKLVERQILTKEGDHLCLVLSVNDLTYESIRQQIDKVQKFVTLRRIEL